jgi:tetratricopeptide (TPR) repeat protein
MFSEYWYVFIVLAFIVIFFGAGIGKAAARALYSRKSGLDPLNCAELRIGQKLELEGKFDQAAKAYKQMIEMYPDSETGHLFLGYLHKKRKDFQAAAEAFRNVLKIDPSSVEALCEVAESARMLGNDREAADLYGEVLAKDAGNADAHYALGVMLLDSDRAKAVTHFKAFKASTGRVVSARLAQRLKQADEILGDEEKNR